MIPRHYKDIINVPFVKFRATIQQGNYLTIPFHSDTKSFSRVGPKKDPIYLTINTEKRKNDSFAAADNK